MRRRRRETTLTIPRQCEVVRVGQLRPGFSASTLTASFTKKAKAVLALGTGYWSSGCYKLERRNAPRRGYFRKRGCWEPPHQSPQSSYLGDMTPRTTFCAESEVQAGCWSGLLGMCKHGKKVQSPGLTPTANTPNRFRLEEGNAELVCLCGLHRPMQWQAHASDCIACIHVFHRRLVWLLGHRGRPDQSLVGDIASVCRERRHPVRGHQDYTR